MSFEKVEKSSGTRHKARECSLHMLFAYDLVRQVRFTSGDYWAELGLEQFHKGANDLLRKVTTGADDLGKLFDQIRILLRRADNLDRESSRATKLKYLDNLNSLLRKTYGKLRDSIANNDAPDSEDVKVVVENIRTNFERLVIDFTHIETLDRTNFFKDEHREIKDLSAKVEIVLNGLSAKTLPSIDEMIVAVTPARTFADKLALGTIDNLEAIDDRIRTRAEHWRIERMAIVDRNVLRLAVFEFLYTDTPHTVVINEALEIARRFSTYEATQFINGILDGIKQDLDTASNGSEAPESDVSAAADNPKPTRTRSRSSAK
ncbi:MAG TPA: transcription antitermination factor NusB [Pyrinomonadaceae bacterium]|nr:transcription antitermination factor NusB [Pyrinomonadaceae bacterium]HQX56148.1 transcription antitermination factor NusB [Pyrinomonadaceae bacterium]HQY66916.1 transcription antitermination factor NusB [Pyrinomonadaceae bacterium]HRA41697.1 transcription antitermination factor NusB [Pyrinomonadaceae bacterium]